MKKVALKRVPDLVQGRVTPATMAQIRAVAGLPDEQINLSDPDSPEITDWSGATRGPVVARPLKTLTHLRLDADVLAWFEAAGPGFQSRINDALRKAMTDGLRMSNPLNKTSKEES